MITEKNDQNSYEFRFIPVDDELIANLDLSQFKFMKDQFVFQYTHLAGIFIEANKPVSLIGLSRPKNDPDTFFMMYAETAGEFKSQGKASLLFHELFNYASESLPQTHFIVEDYTADGLKFLKPKVGKIAGQYLDIRFTEALGFF